MAADHASARLRRSAQEAGEPAVGQDLAAGLARRAVDDLVGLVAHPAQIVPADRAWLPRTPVHREVLTELGGKSAAALPLDLQGVGRARRGSHRPGAGVPVVVELGRATRRARASRGAGCRRLYPRPTPAIVRWSRRIVWTWRLSSPVRKSSSASGPIASGPSLASGPSSPGASTHQPALRSRPNSFTSTDGRSVTRSRSTAPARLRRLRRCLDVDATALRQMDEDAQAPVELERHVLAAAGHPIDPVTERLGGPRLERLQRGELQRIERLEHPAGRDLVEPLGQRLHLRHLRQRSITPPGRRRRAARCRCTPRCDRACVRCDTMHARSR